MYEDITGMSDLQKLRGIPYQVNEAISVRVPKMSEIFEMGEDRYMDMILRICSIPSDMKYPLWEQKIDWTKISDFDFFKMMVSGLSREDTRPLFGETLDFSSMLPVPPGGEYPSGLLVDLQSGVYIDEAIYQKIVAFVRKTHGIFPKLERYANKVTRDMLLAEDENKRLNARLKKAQGAQEDSSLFGIYMTLLCSPEFKYNSETIGNITYMEFIESYRQIMHCVDSRALGIGLYMGNIEFQKVRRKLDWQYSPPKNPYENKQL